jgi:uncharacterized protein (DUF1684 family)
VAVEIFRISAHRQRDSKHETVAKGSIQGAFCKRRSLIARDRSGNDPRQAIKAIVVPTSESFDIRIFYFPSRDQGAISVNFSDNSLTVAVSSAGLAHWRRVRRQPRL